MRITFVLPPDSLGGSNRVLAVYARGLADRGHHVTVVQPRHARPRGSAVLRSLLSLRGWPQSPDASSLSFFENLPIKRMKLSHPGPVTEADVPDADLVIATWWETAEWVWALPASKGRKAHFMQDYEIWGGNLDRVDATCRLPIPKIVVAKWVSNLLHSRFGQEAIALVPNSVDTRLFRAAPRHKQPVPTVGFTYSPLVTKGTDIAMAAINIARKHLPNLRVISFGAAPLSPEFPLPERTEFFHRVPDRELPSLYAACDAWLFGSRIEGFGLPILEAMACRTPVIGAPAGAAPELLAHGGGVQVPMENAEAMAAAIFRIAHMSQAGWRDLSDAALATASSYSWDDATDAFEAALQEIRTGTLARELERVHAAPRKAGVGIIHIVTSKTFDFDAIATDAAAGKSPGHVLLDLAARVPSRFHMPGQDLQISSTDRLRGRLFSSPQLWAFARKVAAETTPDDVIYTSGEDIGFPLAVALAGQRERARLAVTVHNINRPRARLALRLFNLLEKIDLWLTPAPTQADFLLNVGVPASNVQVLPEQTDTRFYKPARAREGRPVHARPIIASVGLEQRDYRTLAAATHDLPVDVRISGFSKDARALRTAFPDPLPANMTRRFFEWPELVELYQSADLVVVPLFPNRYVAGITTFLEALACGRPVIVTRTDGMAAYTDVPGICLTVPPSNPMALRTAIQHLLHSPPTADALARRGHEWLLSGHTSSHWVNAVTELLAPTPEPLPT